MTDSPPMPLAKVLIVDDDAILSQTAAEVLRRQKFEVQISADAETAIGLAHSWHPDLIVLDVVLEDSDGFEMLAKLKASPDTWDIGVVLFTGFPDVASARRATAMGAAYVAKPVRAPELVRIVRERLARAQALSDLRPGTSMAPVPAKHEF